MVTQCTACQVWFKVTREQLHAAHGLVRCSACNTVFNALATLRHDMPEGAVFAGTTAAVNEHSEEKFEDASSREPEVPGCERADDAEPAEQQSRVMADEENETLEEPQAAGSSRSPKGESYIGMPAGEPEPHSESESEFEPEILQETDSQTPVNESIDELDLYMASALDDESIEELAEEAQGEARGRGPDTGAPPSLEETVDRQREAGGAVMDVHDEAFAQQGAGEESWASESPPAFVTERGKPWQRRLWGLVVGLASLVLAAQIVYAQRDALGRIFGLPRFEPVLHQYAISGATLDAARQPGALVLKGAIVNQGHRAQPLPLIRVTLTNRYGDTVGAQILSPRQYGAGQKTLLQAHQHFMFHVKLADPGASAVGFSLVLCKHRGHTILCQDS